MDQFLDRLQSLQDEDAWSAYRVLVATGRDHPEIHLQGALIATRLGRIHWAHFAILEGFAKQPTGVVLGQLRFLYAALLREMGQLDRAVEQFDRWEAELDRYESLRISHLGACYFNRALALRQLERYAESLANYETAAAEFRLREKALWLAMCLQNMAWVCCLSGQPEIARAALDESRPMSNAPPLLWHQRIGELFLASITAVTDEERRGVLTGCQALAAAVDPDLPPSVRSHANWLAGRLALSLDLLSEAQASTEAALLWGATAKDDNRCLADASALWRELRDRVEGGD